MNRIRQLIKNDSQRLSILAAVRELDLPHCYVAAGCIRNMVWDYLHGKMQTPLSDVDVIYFCQQGSTQQIEYDSQKALSRKLPNVNWQVKNQARMHHRNNDAPYLNLQDAMSFWPEKETAIAVRINESNAIEIIAPFGVDSLLAGYLTHNPLRSKKIFEDRIASKQWLSVWPRLKVVY